MTDPVHFDPGHPLAAEVFRLAKETDESSRQELDEILAAAGFAPDTFVVPEPGTIPISDEVLLKTASGVGGVVVRYEVLDRHMMLFHKALDHELCAELVAAAEASDEWSQGTQFKGGKNRTDEHRTSSNLQIRGKAWAKWEEILRTLAHEAGRFYLMWNRHAHWSKDTGFEVLRYEPGQEYRVHVDVLGRRRLSVLVYLNDDYEEGGTFFPLGGELDTEGRPAGRTIRPAAGSILLFEPFLPHCANPPQGSRKYAVVGWLYP